MNTVRNAHQHTMYMAYIFAAEFGRTSVVSMLRIRGDKRTRNVQAFRNQLALRLRST